MKDTDLLVHRYGLRSQFATEAANAGDNVLISVPPDMRLRVTWIAMATSQENTAETLAVVRIGSVVKYRWPLGNPGAFAHWELLEGGLGDDLILNLSEAQPVQFNCSYELNKGYS